MPSSLLIIIPTYNEIEGLRSLIETIDSVRLRNRPDILIVDDGSPDGTGKRAEELRRTRPYLSVLHRPGKRGLGNAYRAGFAWGLSRGYPWLMEMDADLSHRPTYLEGIETMIESNLYDVLIGSRYISGGGTLNWGLGRQLISRFGCEYARQILRCPVRDMTGGFNVWRANVLKAMDLDSIMSDGYAFQIELKYKAFLKGFRYCEFPIIFDERRAGLSKMSKSIVFEAVFNVLRLRWAAHKAKGLGTNPKRGLNPNR